MNTAFVIEKLLYDIWQECYESIETVVLTYQDVVGFMESRNCVKVYDAGRYNYEVWDEQRDGFDYDEIRYIIREFEIGGKEIKRG